MVITPCSIWSQLVSSRSWSWSGGISRWSVHCSPHPSGLYSHAPGIPERLRNRALSFDSKRAADTCRQGKRACLTCLVAEGKSSASAFYFDVDLIFYRRFVHHELELLAPSWISCFPYHLQQQCEWSIGPWSGCCYGMDFGWWISCWKFNITWVKALGCMQTRGMDSFVNPVYLPTLIQMVMMQVFSSDDSILVEWNAPMWHCLSVAAGEIVVMLVKFWISSPTETLGCTEKSCSYHCRSPTIVTNNEGRSLNVVKLSW